MEKTRKNSTTTETSEPKEVGEEQGRAAAILRVRTGLRAGADYSVAANYGTAGPAKISCNGFKPVIK